MTDTRLTVLGIDPGTTTGWAVRQPDGTFISGSWDLKPRRQEGGGMRFVRARSLLWQLLAAYPTLGVVAYEEVRYHRGVDAAHVYGGLVAVITSVCEEQNLAYQSVSVGIWKKRTCGKGNAKKAEVAAVAAERWPGETLGQDEAEARFIAEAAALDLEGA